VLIVKWFIWAVSLGSGTSGGVLAPLLMMGGALGGLEAMFLPNEGAGFWPLVSMGAILGGTMRSPFTSIVFAFELTHDANVFLPLLVGSVIAHAFTVLTLKRSILTEKVARRGFHLSREYAIDPLEILFVREVMRTKVAVLSASSTLGEILPSLRTDHRQKQRLLPVVNAFGQLEGVLTRGDIHKRIEQEGDALLNRRLGELARTNAVEVYPDEPLRVIVYRMAELGFTRMPVVERGSRKLLGLVSLDDLLKARTRHLEEEKRREQTLNLRFFFPGDKVSSRTQPPTVR
jgi:CBS domain-containing protein